ncbi:uncharacterized protein [Typha angustifolia]|uniref:uncharacterized protein n=1 Tax=Typha angustifolia TaxID=59011 RepID=UPI003C2B8915
MDPIQQRDPLSPYLFILVSQLLSDLLNRKVSNGEMLAFKVGEVQISHLLYADDLLITAQATRTNANCIMECLSRYKALSNQRVNCQKSTLYLPTRMPKEQQAELSGSLGLQIAALPFVYLGVIISGRQVKVKEHQALVDHTESRRRSGNQRSQDSSNCAHRKVGVKGSEPGEGSWVNLLIAKYGLLNPWTRMGGQNVSWLWRLIYGVARSLKLSLRKLIGNGSTTSAATEPWLSPVPWSRLPRIMNRWSEHQIITEVGEELAFDILTFQAGCPTTADQWIWWPHPQGTPTVKSIYSFLNPAVEDNWPGWKILWKIQVAPRVRTFVWKLSWRRLPTNAWLGRLGLRYGLECWAELQACMGRLETQVEENWLTTTWHAIPEEDVKVKAIIASMLW